MASLSLIFHWLFIGLVWSRLGILSLSSSIRELGFLGEHIGQVIHVLILPWVLLLTLLGPLPHWLALTRGVSLTWRPLMLSSCLIWLMIAPCLLLIGMIWFRMGGLFTYISRGKIIGDNLFSLMARRTLAFHWLHDRVVNWSRWVIVFEREDTVKEEKGRKCLEYEGNLS